MFDFSFGELALLAVIALLVVGPDKLPELARTAGRWYGALRRVMNNARSEIEQQLLLDELRQEAQKLKDYAETPLVPEARSEGVAETGNVSADAPKSDSALPAETLPTNMPELPPDIAARASVSESPQQLH